MKISKTLKTLIGGIAIATFVTTMTTVVKAEDTSTNNVTMKMTSNTSVLKANEDVTINVAISSINTSITGILGKLEYDTNVFETVESSSVTGQSPWTVTGYSATTKNINIASSEKVSKPQNVLTIKMKTKSAINVDSTTIKLTGNSEIGNAKIDVSGGDVADGGTGDIYVEPVSVTLTRENATPNITKSSTPSAASSSKTTSKKDSTALKSATLPKTGISKIVPAVILSTGLVALVSLVLYKKISKDIK